MAITPLMVDLEGKKVVIVGGGKVACRRVDTLKESGASITIISPEIEAGIHSLWDAARVNWQQKEFEPDDLEGAFLVIVATNNPAVNQAVVKSSPPNSLLNVTSDASQGNIHFPSNIKRGELSVSISTNGASPLLSAKIKQQLETIFDDRYIDYVDFLYESRQLIKHTTLTKTERRSLLKELLSDDFLDGKKQQQTIDWLRSL
ncbi:NAD(P)-binding protein [Virgibacillus sp. L01]|uniref:NAD(P)-binding protein n=1 Tax=Virgibacillus sp. L01 TaxID=3457429 RepID=UPI003FCFECBD